MCLIKWTWGRRRLRYVYLTVVQNKHRSWHELDVHSEIVTWNLPFVLIPDKTIQIFPHRHFMHHVKVKTDSCKVNKATMGILSQVSASNSNPICLEFHRWRYHGRVVTMEALRNGACTLNPHVVSGRLSLKDSLSSMKTKERKWSQYFINLLHQNRSSECIQMTGQAKHPHTPLPNATKTQVCHHPPWYVVCMYDVETDSGQWHLSIV